MWPRLVNAALGIWLMAAPAVLAYGSNAAATNERITGPIIATFSIIAIWQATRATRWMSVAAGAWLLIAPWIFGFETRIVINEMLVGAVVIALGLIEGKKDQRFGGGWRTLWSGEVPQSHSTE